MQVKISARHGHLSETSQEFIRDKAQKLLHIFGRLTMIDVTVDLKDTHRPEVEILVSAEHKHDFVSRETANDLVSAVDSAVHKLEQQLRRYKEKVQDHRRDPSTSEVAGPLNLDTSEDE